ncbi:MAG: divalent cation tolerance protein CutA [Flavobacteriales bacterium]|nr:divalent cation tolerance protein CutA [Flavobacteriales bacterium]MCB9191923.1 divalent cation tolerance protein CutA [Flavobacteriales bacterium]
MIFIRVASKSEEKIEQIATTLLKEKLAIDVNIKRDLERAELINDRLVTSPIYLLTAKTRAVLFDTIDKLLNEMYPNNLPEVYALPIMQMDWKQAEKLTKDVQSVSRRVRLKQVIKRVSGKH